MRKISKFQQFKSEYKTKGFTVIRDFFAKDYIRFLQGECEKILSKANVGLIEDVEYRLLPWGGKLIERIDPIICYSKVFSDLSSNKDFLQMIQESTGLSSHLKLLKDKLIFKPPFQDGYPPHQDMSWWQALNIQKALSVIIAIDPCNQENGAVEFLVGSNRQLLTSVNEPRYLSKSDLKRFKAEKWELITLQPGDVCIFCALTIHKSNANNSSSWRKNLYFTYGLNVAEEDIYATQQQLYLQRRSIKHSKKIQIMNDIY